MKIPFLAILLLSFAGLATAQPRISFQKTAHSFGTIPEAGGQVETRFAFTNTGNAPLTVSQVAASCGCTTPEWTKTPVAPGDSGYVLARFNPMNRPGAFNKNLTVYSNAESPSVMLIISGTVKEREKTIRDQLPDSVAPNFRIQTRYLTVGKVSPLGGNGEVKFQIHNPGKVAASYTPAKGTPKWMTLQLPANLKPGETATARLAYSGTKRAEYGSVNDKLTITVTPTGGKPYPVALTVTALVEDEPKVLSDSARKEAPHFAFMPYGMLDLGSARADGILEKIQMVGNVGKGTVKILAVKPDCECITVKMPKTELKAGESMPVTVRLDGLNKSGSFQHRIAFYTTDPVEPTQYLRAEGSIAPRNPKTPGVKPAKD